MRDGPSGSVTPLAGGAREEKQEARSQKQEARSEKQEAREAKI
jgi:hypothetical protein